MASDRSNNIILTGFMGAGKTTVGKVLARRLGWRFMDLDRVIERKAGMSVKALFRRRGEPAFRVLEYRAIRELAGFSRRVVATGGGAPVLARNRVWLRRAGLVIYLQASPAVLAARLRGASGRPLLARARGDKAVLLRLIAVLLSRREQNYRKADFTLRSGQFTVSHIANRIVAMAGVRLANRRRTRTRGV